MATDKSILKDWFKTGKKPTQSQFWAWMDSYWHKDEKISQSDISGLEETLNAKAEKSQLDGHKSDPDAHHNLFIGKEDKSQKGLANGYVPLDEFSKIAYQYLTIVNNLTAGGTTSMLSAQQGVVLQGQIDAINTLLSSDDIDLDTIQEIVEAIKDIETYLGNILVNDLTTGGVTKALTAEMGKQLNLIKLTATLATDAETQIDGVVPEDNKVVSRVKLFNWWTWIKTQTQIISGVWNFNNKLGVGVSSPAGNFDVATGSGTITNPMNLVGNGTISFGNGSAAGAVPNIIGKSNDSVGLQLMAGSYDGNASPDMSFNVRKNDNTDFTTLTTIAFRFSRYGTVLVDMFRNGRLDINTGLAGNTANLTAQAPGTISFANGSTLSTVPMIIGKSNNSQGLSLEAGTHDGNTFPDMAFNVRKNDDTDFTILNKSAFRFVRYTTPLIDIFRDGKIGIGTTSPTEKVDVNGCVKALGINIPNGILTTVPVNGAIERDLNGVLWETSNGVRKKITPTITIPSAIMCVNKREWQTSKDWNFDLVHNETTYYTILSAGTQLTLKALFGLDFEKTPNESPVEKDSDYSYLINVNPNIKLGLLVKTGGTNNIIDLNSFLGATTQALPSGSYKKYFNTIKPTWSNNANTIQLYLNKESTESSMSIRPDTLNDLNLIAYTTDETIKTYPGSLVLMSTFYSTEKLNNNLVIS